MMVGTIEIMVVILILVIVFVAIFLIILTKKKDMPINISENEKSTINTHMTDKLMESKNLLDRGIITEEEFEEMKKDIMGK
jgi:uncharacterized membrane protein